jgi:propanol-preferring alcohol dehydrogenase
MLLEDRSEALTPAIVDDPTPGAGEVLLRVRACGVCRTDLHILDGDLPDPELPLIMGHQIVGTVEAVGAEVVELVVGERVGVPWLGWTCGECAFCARGQENLCQRARFTGYDLAGGFAELTVADARFCFPIPEGYPDEQAAPLLCAGLIGWRCLRLAGEDATRLGLYGFGAAAHLLTQVAVAQGREVFAFTRAGDVETQAFARDLGAAWAGPSTEPPPEPLDAAILFADAGELIPLALGALVPGGTVVCGEIHMTDVPSFPYDLLWGERSIRSVANLTRRDGVEFLTVAPMAHVASHVTAFPLDEVNEALGVLRAGDVRGAVVIDVGP